MEPRAQIERLEALVASREPNAVVPLRAQIVDLDRLRARVGPVTRARIEALSTMIALVVPLPSGMIDASGSPRFKQWLCAASGSLSINATGAPVTKQWTCIASGNLVINAAGAPSTKQWTCVASGYVLPSGLSIWLKADVGVTLVGSDVSAWADQSGNAHNFQQTTSTIRPTFDATGLNGKPSVKFTAASSQFLQSTASNIARDWLLQTTPLVLNYTGFAVIINNSTAAINATSYLSPAIISDDPASGGDNIGFHIGNDKFAAYHWIGSVAKADPAVSTGVAIQIRGKWDNVSQDLIGKTPSATVTRAATGSPSSVSNGTGINIGSNAAPRQYFNGYLSELMWFNRALTAAEVTQVEAYLSARWGV